jgi:hypothetical protein
MRVYLFPTVIKFRVHEPTLDAVALTSAIVCHWVGDNKQTTRGTCSAAAAVAILSMWISSKFLLMDLIDVGQRGLWEPIRIRQSSAHIH